MWVFIAQLVEHCSVNAEVMGLNPVEALKSFGPKIRSYLNKNCNYNCDDHIFTLSVFLPFKITFIPR